MNKIKFKAWDKKNNSYIDPAKVLIDWLGRVSFTGDVFKTNPDINADTDIDIIIKRIWKQ